MKMQPLMTLPASFGETRATASIVAICALRRLDAGACAGNECRWEPAVGPPPHLPSPSSVQSPRSTFKRRCVDSGNRCTAVGLTESLGVGYRFSPRGQQVLANLAAPLLASAPLRRRAWCRRCHRGLANREVADDRARRRIEDRDPSLGTQRLEHVTPVRADRDALRCTGQGELSDFPAARTVDEAHFVRASDRERRPAGHLA